MNALDRARAAVADSLPARWRVVWLDNSEEPTGIAPVCPDEEHEEADGSVYDCCPDPAIDTEDVDLAAYLVALINADLGGGR
ncbi:hypothetical protein [Streptomyces sp. W1SF4]|uniref:hypothetical protein n=1 Tax=Streptomyces sp. W1SF4 TaxID=2305220 RepID=UPI000F704DEB|nr:hypothetical protein [Streptomyces sp. W1SF4]AZM91472.1 hypothetical protein D1J60_25805 [Streptomyces sp. W1SF4]